MKYKRVDCFNLKEVELKSIESQLKKALKECIEVYVIFSATSDCLSLSEDSINDITNITISFIKQRIRMKNSELLHDIKPNLITCLDSLISDLKLKKITADSKLNCIEKKAVWKPDDDYQKQAVKKGFYEGQNSILNGLLPLLDAFKGEIMLLLERKDDMKEITNDDN